MRAPPVLLLLLLPLGSACGGSGRCTVERVSIESFCLPDPGLAETSLTVRVREQCGGCGEGPPQCEVDDAFVDAGTLLIEVSHEACPVRGGCAAICTLREASCTMPPLPAGRYDVKVNGGATQTLVVSESGAADCALPPF